MVTNDFDDAITEAWTFSTGLLVLSHPHKSFPHYDCPVGQQGRRHSDPHYAKFGRGHGKETLVWFLFVVGAIVFWGWGGGGLFVCLLLFC